jgi:hypothetical protein
LLLLTAPSLGSAQPSYVWTEFGDQRNPAVACGANQDAYLVVYEYSPDPCFTPATTQVIRGVLLSQQYLGYPHVTRVPSGFVIHFGSGQAPQSAPDVAHNHKDNRYVVVWQEEQGTDGDSNILAQVVDSKGQASPAVTAVADTPEPEASPKIAYNGDSNEFLVVFQKGLGSDNDENDASGIWGRRLSSNGTTQGAAFKITDIQEEGETFEKAEGVKPPVGGVANPAVSYGTDLDRYLVAWERLQQKSWRFTARDIRATHVSGHGKAKIEPRFCISCETGPPGHNVDEIQPDITYNPHDRRWLVVFSMDSDPRRLPYNEDIAAVAVGTKKKWGPLIKPINSSSPYRSDRRHPRVVYSEARERYLVVWDEQDFWWLYPQRIDGAVLDPNGGVMFRNAVSLPFYWCCWYGAQVPALQSWHSAPALAINPKEAKPYVVWDRLSASSPGHPYRLHYVPHWPYLP